MYALGRKCSLNVLLGAKTLSEGNEGLRRTLLPCVLVLALRLGTGSGQAMIGRQTISEAGLDRRLVDLSLSFRQREQQQS